MSNQQMAKLSRLPVNKTVVFYSPIEGKDVFVRTGTMAEGNSLIHSLLHACSKDYMFRNDKDKMKSMNKIYKKVLIGKWKNEPVDRELFLKEITTILTDLYDNKGIVSKKLESDMEIYRTLCELVTLENFLNVILPSGMDKSEDRGMKKYRENIIEETKNFTYGILEGFGNNLEEERKEFFMKKISELINTTLLEAENMLFKQFLKKEFVVDTDSLKIISNIFNRDIYFFNGANRLPCTVIKDNIIKGRKSVFVIVVDNHYEIVGKLLSGNKIQRQFERKDPIVKRVKAFLYHPDIIEDHYPQLIPYLAKAPESRSESSSSSEEERSEEERSEEDGSEEERSNNSQESNESQESQESQESENSREEEAKRESKGNRRNTLRKSTRKTRHRR